MEPQSYTLIYISKGHFEAKMRMMEVKPCLDITTVAISPAWPVEQTPGSSEMSQNKKIRMNSDFQQSLIWSGSEMQLADINLLND